MITDLDVSHWVEDTLGDFVNDFDVNGIVRCLMNRYELKGINDLDDIDTDDYTDLIQKFDTSNK